MSEYPEGSTARAFEDLDKALRKFGRSLLSWDVMQPAVMMYATITALVFVAGLLFGWGT